MIYRKPYQIDPKAEREGMLQNNRMDRIPPNALTIRHQEVTVGEATAVLVQLFNGGWWVRFNAEPCPGHWSHYAKEFPTLQEARVYAMKMLLGGLK